MKKLLMMLVLSLCVSATAWAIPAEAEKMRFVPVDAGKSLEQDTVYRDWLKLKMIKPAIVEGSGNVQLVSHDKLAGAFYAYAASQKDYVPVGVKDEGVYVKLWLRANGLSSGVSSTAQFRQHVIKNGQLRLLTEADLVGNGTGAPVVAPATATVVVASTPAVSSAVAELTRELTRLKGEIKDAKTEAAGNNKKLVTLASDKLGILNQQVLDIKEQLTKLPGTAEVNELKGQVATVVGSIEGITRTQEEQGTQIGTLWLAVGGSFLLVLLLGIGNNRRVKAVQQEIGTVAAEVKGNAIGTSKRLGNLASRVSNLERVVHRIHFTEEVVTPAALAMMEIGGSITVDINKINDDDTMAWLCSIEVVRSGEESVDIYGIERRKGSGEKFVTVSIDSVARTIYRAHNDVRMPGLVVPLEQAA